MVAFSLLCASLVLSGLFPLMALAAPTKTVLTPFGERPVGDVHAVPEGKTIHESEMHQI